MPSEKQKVFGACSERGSRLFLVENVPTSFGNPKNLFSAGPKQIPPSYRKTQLYMRRAFKNSKNVVYHSVCLIQR